MMKKSDYDYKIINNYLLIKDNAVTSESSFMSVTNNIEQVLTEIIKSEPVFNIRDYIVVYRDSNFSWDKVEIKTITDNIVTNIHFSDEEMNQDYFHNLYFN